MTYIQKIFREEIAEQLGSPWTMSMHAAVACRELEKILRDSQE